MRYAVGVAVHTPLATMFLNVLLCLACISSAAASCGPLLGSAADGTLPVAKPNGTCGAFVAVCPDNQCCSQYGNCRAACTSTCMCEYSGKLSNCPGTTNISNYQVPVAKSGAVCGRGVATCPDGECCTQYGFCTTSETLCAAGCKFEESGRNSSCKQLTDVKVIRYTLTAQWEERAPDGFSRQAITLNGQTPGPTIRCVVGDRLVIQANNKLDVPMSIHWHGMLHRGTVSMDGVAGVTQRAIGPNSSQLYNFDCTMPGDYWYHSHFKGQYMDGLRGALVVDPKDYKTPPSESVLNVFDWYHDKSDNILKSYLGPGSIGCEPKVWAGLINGIGQGNCTEADCDYAVLPASLGPCSDGNTVIRIVNSAGFLPFTISIDDHLMVVTAIDAVPIVPSQPVKAVRINAAQRYRVAVCRADNDLTNTEPAWIRVVLDESWVCDGTEGTPNNTSPSLSVLGVLQYGNVTDKPLKLPTTQPDRLAVLPPAETAADAKLLVATDLADGGTLIPFSPISGATPPPSTHTYYLEIEFYDEPRYPPSAPRPANATNYAHFNNIAMVLPADGGPSAPSVLEIVSADQTLPANKDFGYHIITVPEGAVVDIVVYNSFMTSIHPLHLHGHWMWVMGRGLPGAGPFNASTYVPSSQPTLRDTATVSENSWTVLRFVADNPGTWLFHCHIDWHLEAGLGLVWRYGIGSGPYSPESDILKMRPLAGLAGRR